MIDLDRSLLLYGRNATKIDAIIKALNKCTYDVSIHASTREVTKKKATETAI